MIASRDKRERERERERERGRREKDWLSPWGRVRARTAGVNCRGGFDPLAAAGKRPGERNRFN